MRRRAIPITAVLLAGCRLFVETDGLSGGAPLGADAGSADVTVTPPPPPSPVDGGTPDATVEAGIEAGPDADADAAVTPIAFVGSSYKEIGSSSTSIDVQTPAGVVANDVIVVGLFTDYSATVVPTPSGWSKIGERTIPLPSDTRATWFLRVASNGEPASTAFTYTASPVVAAIALAYRNVRTATPVDQASYADDTGMSHIAPAITTTVPGAMLVAIFTADDTIGAVWQTPIGMTARNTNGIIGAYDRLLGAPGSTGTVGVATDTSAGAQSAMIALAPAN